MESSPTGASLLIFVEKVNSNAATEKQLVGQTQRDGTNAVPCAQQDRGLVG